MGRGCSVGISLLFALGMLSVPLYGQVAEIATQGPERGFRLEQNYPNPFSVSTRIPFVLEESLFEAGRQAAVSIRVLNVLQQLVGVPTALDHPAGNGIPVSDLVYPQPGRMEALWDGRDRNGRDVASGVYYLQIVVNGETSVRRLIVAR